MPLQPRQSSTPYSKKQIDRAGKTLISNDVSQEEINQAFAILNSWRAAHVSPLNTITDTLVSNNPNDIVVQRLKRLDSIPKTSGYRSYHLVYQSNDSLLVEIQFRTYL